MFSFSNKSSISNEPFTTVACFCQEVLHEATGVISLIRIIDTVMRQETDVQPPEQMPGFHYEAKFVCTIFPGKLLGEQSLRLVQEAPNQKSWDVFNTSITFRDVKHSSSLVWGCQLEFSMEGQYLFQLYLAGSKLTTIPLHVDYARVFTK